MDNEPMDDQWMNERYQWTDGGWKDDKKMDGGRIVQLVLSPSEVVTVGLCEQVCLTTC